MRKLGAESLAKSIRWRWAHVGLLIGLAIAILTQLDGGAKHLAHGKEMALLKIS